MRQLHFQTLHSSHLRHQVLLLACANRLCLDLKKFIKDGNRPTLKDLPMTDIQHLPLEELIAQCWDQNPSNRPTMQSVVKTISAMCSQQVSVFWPMTLIAKATTWCDPFWQF
jgi:hypothetical protein